MFQAISALEPSAASAGDRPRCWPRQLAAAVLLTLAGIAVYANGFRAPFVFDAESAILDNPAVKQVWHWCSPVSVGRLQGGNRPIGFLSFALNYAWSGFDAWSFHAVNLAIHVAAAWLLFDIVRRTLSRGRLAARFGAQAWIPALAIALVWLVHPLQTQSVTNLYQRLESQAGLFYLATLWSFVRALEGSNPLGWYAASVAFCLLGAGTKENLVTAPLVVLWYDRAFASSSWRETFSRRGGYYAALTATWILVALLMFGRWVDFLRGDVLFVKNISPLRYAMTQPGVILHYLRLTFWPDELCLDYGWPAAQAANEIVPQALAVGALLALTAWSAYRWPAWGFLGGWFFLTLAPSSSFVPVADMAVEHRMYLPLAAVVTLVVMACWCAVQNRPRAVRALAGAVLLATVAALGYRSIVRNEDYRSARLIWEITLGQRPNFVRPYQALARLMLADGESEQALQLLNRALEINPEFTDAYNDRGNLYQDRGELDRALADYDRAIAVNPRFSTVYSNRGNALAKLGKYDEAIADYSRALELGGDFFDAYNGRGSAYTRLKDFDRAIQDFNRAIQLRPDVAGAYANRGLAYGGKGDLQSAVADCDKAIQLDRKCAAAYVNRALVYYSLGRYREAWKDVRTAEKLGSHTDPQLLESLEQADPEDATGEPRDSSR